MSWEPFDSSWLVDLAKSQYPKDPWLADSLSRCTKCLRDGESYLFFISRESAKDQNFDFLRNLDLRHPEFGRIVLDVLKNREIGGLEFLDKYSPHPLSIKTKS